MGENKRGGERKLGLGGEGIFMNVGVGSGEVGVSEGRNSAKRMGLRNLV